MRKWLNLFVTFLVVGTSGPTPVIQVEWKDYRVSTLMGSSADITLSRRRSACLFRYILNALLPVKNQGQRLRCFNSREKADWYAGYCCALRPCQGRPLSGCYCTSAIVVAMNLYQNGFLNAQEARYMIPYWYLEIGKFLSVLQRQMCCIYRCINLISWSGYQMMYKTRTTQEF